MDEAITYNGHISANVDGDILTCVTKIKHVLRALPGNVTVEFRFQNGVKVVVASDTDVHVLVRNVLSRKPGMKGPFDVRLQEGDS